MSSTMYLTVLTALLTLVVACNDQDPDMKKGKELYELGDYSQAIDFFAKAEEKDPKKNVEALIWIGRSHEKLKDDGRAMLAYQMALSLDSTNTELLMAVGDIAVRNGHWKSSYGVYEKVLQSPDAEKFAKTIMSKVGYMPYRSERLFPGLYMWGLHQKDNFLVYIKQETYDQKSVRVFSYDLTKSSGGKVAPLNEKGLPVSLDIDHTNSRIVALMSGDNGDAIYATKLAGGPVELLGKVAVPGYQKTRGGTIKVSPNGDMIVFSACSYRQPKKGGKNSRVALYTVDPEGGKAEFLLEVHSDPMAINASTYSYSRWQYYQEAGWRARIDFTISPNGKAVYYLRPLEQQLRSHLWRYDLKTGKATQLFTEQFKNARGLGVSPIGEYLAFATSSRHKGDTPALYLIDIEERVNTAIKNAAHPTFLDNNILAYTRNDTLFYRDLASGESQHILTGITRNILAISKNGKSLFINGKNVSRIKIPPETISTKEFLNDLQTWK